MAGEENIGGLTTSVAVDTSQVEPGLSVVDSALGRVEGRLRDAQGRFVAAGGAAVGMGSSVAASGAGLDRMADAWGRLPSKLSPADAAMEEIASKATRTSSIFVQAGTDADEGAEGAGNFARGMIEISRGIEDFSTGGFIGILNNIPGIFSNMGAAVGLTGGALASATAGVSMLATGAYILYRNWDSLTSLWEEKNPFPESSNSLQGMQDRLKDVGKELEGLKELDSLDNAQLERANSLLAQRDKLEKEITAEKGRQQKLESFKTGKTAEETAAGSEFVKAVGPDREGFVASVKAAMDVMAEREVGRAEGRMNRDIARMDAGDATPQEKLDYANRRKGEFANYARDRRGADRTSLAEDFVLKLTEGDPAARKQLDAMMNAGTGVMIGGEGFRARLGAKEQSEKDKAEAAALEAEQKRNVASYDARVKARDAADKAESDRLIAEGRRGESEYDAKVKAEKEKKARLDKGIAANVSGFLADDAEAAKLTAKGGDLQWKLMNLMNPTREVKQLAGDAYAASMHGSTGISEEAKRLHEILKVEEEIRENTANLKNVGLKRGRR